MERARPATQPGQQPAGKNPAFEGAFRTLVEKMSDGVVVIGKTGVIRYVNPAGEALLGKPAGDLVGCLFGTPLLPNQRTEIDLFHGREPGRLAEMSVVEIDWEGEPAYLASLRDVTERRRAGNALRFLAQASNVLADSLDYRTTLKNVVQLAVLPMADWCLIDLLESDQLHRVVAFDPTRAGGPSTASAAGPAEALLPAAPLSPEELANRLSGWIRLDWNSTLGLPEALRSGTLRVSGEVSEPLLRSLAGDDEQLRLLRRLGIKSVLIAPLEARGRHIGAITFLSLSAPYRYDKPDQDLAQDLAHRVALAVDNARMYDEVQQALRKRDEFLAMLAHELRNPLAPILHASHLMKQAGTLEPRLELARATIERQGQHISRLLDDLLDLSRITHGKIELRKRPIDISSVIADAVQTSRALVEGRQHRLTIDQEQGPLLVEGDPTRLAQVLGNLLNNAAKYTPQGGRIELSVRGTDSEVVIRVRDSGIGIPPAMLAQVFEPFTQVNPSLDRAQGGLGIGLTLVRNLVEMHDGQVIGHSGGEERGSEFTVYLPRWKDEAATASGGREPPVEAGQELSSDSTGGSRPPLAFRRVFVIEDNADARELLVELLRLWGHTVESAGDGMSGLELLRRSWPDVALIDIGLPNLDGYKLAQQVRALPGGERILLVALTGYGQVEARRKSLEAGFDAHLVKPVDLNQLEQILAQGTRTKPIESKA